MAKTLKGAFQAVTANRLSDGAAVWRSADGGWSTAFADAEICDAARFPAALDAAQADAAAQIVVEPYGVAVAADTAAPEPLAMRERIRAQGPSVPYGAASWA